MPATRRSGRRSALIAKVTLAALLTGSTGCYKFQPISAAAPPPAKELEGRLIRFKEGPYQREMQVTVAKYPWVGGDTADEQGAVHPVTMDLRMMKEPELRTGSSPAKVTLIVVGSTIVAGALAGMTVALLKGGGGRVGF